MLRGVVAAAALAGLAQAETAEFLWEDARGGWIVDDLVLSSAGATFAVGYTYDSQEWRLAAYTADGVTMMDRYFSNGTVAPGAGFALPRPVGAVLDEARKELLVLGVLGDGAGGAQAVLAAFSADQPTLLRPVRQTVLGGKAFRPRGLALGADGSVTAAVDEWDVEQIGVAIARVAVGGQLQWTTRAAPGASLAVGGRAVGVTSAGAAYVALRKQVLRVSAAGAVEWTVDQPAETLAVLADDTAIVSTPLLPTGQTALLRADGTAAWTTAIGGTHVAAKAGRVWVGRTRFVEGTNGGNTDWQVYQLDAATGAQRWERKVGGSRQDLLGGLAVDAEGNAYAAGSLSVRSGFLNLAWSLRAGVVKFDADGAELWTAERSGHTTVRGVAFHADPARVVVGALNAVIGFEVTAGSSCAKWMWWC